MKRRETGSFRFITFSCNRRLPLFTNPSVCRLFTHSLAAARAKHHFELFAWVIMPEHIHLMLRPPDGTPLDRALLSIKLSVAKRAIDRLSSLDRIRDGAGSPRFWQKGGGFDRNVRDESEFVKEVRYIHRNPVERGLVDRAELWPWSSARWWLGHRDGEVECDPPPGDPRKWHGPWFV
jgi:putative transposase